MDVTASHHLLIWHFRQGSGFLWSKYYLKGSDKWFSDISPTVYYLACQSSQVWDIKKSTSWANTIARETQFLQFEIWSARETISWHDVPEFENKMYNENVNEIDVSFLLKLSNLKKKFAVVTLNLS